MYAAQQKKRLSTPAIEGAKANQAQSPRICVVRSKGYCTRHLPMLVLIVLIDIVIEEIRGDVLHQLELSNKDVTPPITPTPLSHEDPLKV
ncbi:hypothetical protein TNCV_3662021 [Trichonephila clavipes]|nr:hypothetical protein TNCV_3662021 [Trichonephila clavipes]